jgi:hypothetical protein
LPRSAKPSKRFGGPSLDQVIGRHAHPSPLVVESGLEAQLDSEARNLRNRDDVDGIERRKVDAKDVRETNVAARPSTAIGRTTIEANAPSDQASRLALNPEEVGSAEVDDEVERMAITKGKQDSKSTRCKSVEDRCLTCIAFCPVFTLQTISSDTDASRPLLPGRSNRISSGTSARSSVG